MTGDVRLDLTEAARSLRRAPGFAALAIGILSIAIGAAVLMFSLVEAVLLRSLPFTEPDRVVWMYNLRTERDRAPLSIPDVEDYRRDVRSFAGLAVFTNWTANLTGLGPAERIEGTRVSGDFFTLLGLRAQLGRSLTSDDEERESRVVVVTHGFWTRRLGADPGAIGRGVLLNGATYTLVGVLPPGFMFPFRDAEVAVPLTLRADARRADRGANFLRALGRLAPGVSLADAKAELDTVAHRLRQQYPNENARKIGISLYPLHAEIVRDYRTILWTLLAAVGALLAVGCGNLANLLLLRHVRRRTEFAIRLSLGASRARVLRLLLCEAALLAAAGGILGLSFALLGIRIWRAWGPANFPQAAEIGINPQVLTFTALLMLFTVLACGLLPAWLAARDPVHDLKISARTTTGARARVRRTFVGIQAAAGAALLVAMGITARGLQSLERVSPGFTPDDSLSIQLSLPPATYANKAALVRFADALKARLDALPEAADAGMVSLLPLSGLLSTMDVRFPDRPAPPPEEVPQAHFRVASAGYFAAAGTAVIEGREFSSFDRLATEPVAVVSRTFAGRHWPGESAVGKGVQLGTAGGSVIRRIVGVVEDVKHVTLDAPATADLYVPLHQMPDSQAQFLAARMFWVVRPRAGATGLAPAVRETIRAIDGTVATSSERTLEAVLASSLGSRRVNLRLLEVFGQLAALLCGLGVYAVAGFSAEARRREFALRMALGASPRHLTVLMLRHELWPVLLGITAGLAAAFVAAPRIIESALEVDPRDPSVYGLVAAILLVIAGAASLGPVRRATGTNPAEALNAQ